MALIYTLLVAHFVADFLCQSDWMALNKGKRWDALTLHVGAYTLALAPFAAWAYTYSSPTDATLPFGLWLIVNAVAHFVQDAITSRINSRLWFLPLVGQGMRPEWIQVEVKSTRHWFFVGIGADQLLHYITLFATAEWLLT